MLEREQLPGSNFALAPIAPLEQIVFAVAEFAAAELVEHNFAVVQVLGLHIVQVSAMSASQVSQNFAVFAGFVALVSPEHNFAVVTQVRNSVAVAEQARNSVELVAALVGSAES